MSVSEQMTEWCFTALGDLGRWINQQEISSNPMHQIESGDNLIDERYARNPTVKFFSTLISRSIALQRGYQPTKEWLENGHFQTIYSMVNSTVQEKVLVKCLDVRMTLEHAWDGTFQGVANNNTTFHSRYGYQLHVDVFPTTLDDSVATPTLILIGLDHGSSLGPGHSHQLAQQQMALMKLAYSKKGWRTVSIQSIAPLPPSHFTSIDRSTNQDNWQNAVRETVTKKCTTHSDAPPSSHDIRVAIEWLALRFKDSKLIAVSHFLGANALVKYLGEVGCHTPLIGAISIANPFDIKSFHHHLQAQSNEVSPINRYLYSPALVMGRKAHFIYEFAKHQYKVWNQLFGVLSGSVPLQPIPGLILDGKSIADTNSSCEQFLKNITLPLLCIQSLDDPFLPKATIPYSTIAQSPYIHLVTTRHGGHLGWHQLKPTTISSQSNLLIQNTSCPPTPRFVSKSRATTALSTLSPQLPTSSTSSSSSNSFISPPPTMPQPTAITEVTDQWSHQVILDFATLAFARFTKLKW